MHDLHATMLRLLGIDHLRFANRYQGRDLRLTDVAGTVIDKILACIQAATRFQHCGEDQLRASSIR